MKSKDVKTCKGCDAKCCKYIATEIDKPETLEDFEDIKWYVAHENVKVFVDEEGDWYLEFTTRCKFLGKDNMCTDYENRPKICREYNQEECLFFNEDYEEKFTFENVADVEKYIEREFLPKMGKGKKKTNK